MKLIIIISIVTIIIITINSNNVVIIIIISNIVATILILLIVSSKGCFAQSPIARVSGMGCMRRARTHNSAWGCSFKVQSEVSCWPLVRVQV